MSRRGGGTQYMLLAQNLLRQIGDGTYPPDALLPSELELCRQYRLSRITVRAAMRELQTRGVITRHAGVGTKVAAPRPRATFLHVGDSIDDILEFTRGLSFHVLDTHEVVADADLSATLGLAEGERFVCVTGVRRAAAGPPAVFSTHYLPALVAGAVAELEGQRGSLAELLATRHGESIDEVRQSLDATRLPAAAARALEARAGTPCLRSRRRYFAGGGELIIASISLFPEGRYAFNSRLRRARQGEALAP